MSHVFINRREIEVPAGMQLAGVILEAGDYGPDYNLFFLEGEGDPSGGEQIDRTQMIDVTDGMHFRAIPGNANFGDQSC